MSATRRLQKGIAFLWLAAFAFGLAMPGGPRALAAPGKQAPNAVLLFGIGIHIEPFGATPSKIVRGTAAPPPSSTGLDYNNRALFNQHTQLVRLLASVVEKHTGRLTVQAQSPYTVVAARAGSTIFRDLEAHGHEIALHFHEDAHLGPNAERLPAETWAAVMSEEIELIRQTGVAGPIRYWSGGNLYPGILEAASRAGLTIMSDYKNPRTQQSDALVLGVNPWRPAEGPSERGLAGFARHDPAGKIIYLPDGRFRRLDYAASRRTQNGGDTAYFQYLTGELLNSVKSAQAGKVNVFHITIHPGEFRGSPDQPYTLVDQWLTTVVDPLVKSGKVRWATFGEMADAYLGWERANPGADPRAGDTQGATQPGPTPSPSPAYEVGAQFAGYYERISGAQVLGPPIGPAGGNAQYFEKGRLEDHSASTQGDWAFSYGLLVPELIAARARVRIAGATGPTYADLAAKTGPDARVTSRSAEGGLVLNADGSVFIPFDPGLAGRSGHNVPAHFWHYMNRTDLFPGGWLHDTGLPLSEPFTIQVIKGADKRPVVVQIFERAILSYDPKNPAEFQVERANVGLAYREAFPDKVLGR